MQLSLISRYLIASVTCFLFFPSCGESRSYSGVENEPQAEVHTDRGELEDLNKLTSKAGRLRQQRESDDCREFFNEFPDSLSEFSKYYGFDEENSAGPLYREMDSHLQFFFWCDEVSAEERLTRLINMGKAGGYLHDNESIVIFQDLVYEAIVEQPLIFRGRIESVSDQEASAFLYFLFDRAHPGDSQIRKRVETIERVLGPGSRQAKLLRAQYEKAIEDWRDS